MKRIDTKHNLEFTTEEVELLVNALKCECEYRDEQIAELDDDTEENRDKRRELMIEYISYFRLLRELGEIVGRYFGSNTY